MTPSHMNQITQIREYCSISLRKSLLEGIRVLARQMLNDPSRQRKIDAVSGGKLVVRSRVDW